MTIIEQKAFVEAYFDEMMPKMITQRAHQDAQKGNYTPPIWSNERDEFIRINFAKRGMSASDIENMIRVGRDNFKSLIDFYNEAYRQYQKSEVQAA